MEPIEALRQDAFLAYISEYADATPANLSYILRYWNEAKANWFHLFGDRLTIEKPICYTEDKADTEDHMRALATTPEYIAIYKAFSDKLYDFFRYGSERYEAITLLDIRALTNNCYTEPDITLPFPQPIKIQHGCKPLRTLHKILRAMDFPEETFEAFRIAHSQVLNSRKVYGTLCLSIDPLDYITMSDNDLGWDSCMCWVDHSGEYHGGTIEMMNSPNVLVAYIKSDEDYYPCGPAYPFSNKKWRQLIIADSSIILGNRHYPFECPEAESEALYWVASLLGAEHFSDKIVPINNRDDNGGIYISINTKVMYNDIYNSRNAILPKEPHNIRMNISGPRVCMQCGEEISPGDPPEWVVCGSCQGVEVCSCCDEYIDTGDCFTNSDGQVFCRSCFENGKVSFCSNCEEPYLQDEMNDFSIDLDFERSDVRYASLCPHCSSLISFGDFGEINDCGDYLYENCTPEAKDFIDGLNI